MAAFALVMLNTKMALGIYSAMIASVAEFPAAIPE